jgi:hypothetical protein
MRIYKSKGAETINPLALVNSVCSMSDVLVCICTLWLPIHLHVVAEQL